MDRLKVYTILVQELERFRGARFEELAVLIDGPVMKKTMENGSGPLVIEVRVEWAKTHGGAVRIWASADGPSWWRLERMEESIVVSPTAEG